MEVQGLPAQGDGSDHSPVLHSWQIAGVILCQDGQKSDMTDLLPLDLLSHVFLRSQVLAEGCSDREIAKRVKSGEWHRLRRGAFVSGDTWARLDPSQQHALVSRAVLLQAKTSVVLSHISALPEYGAPTWGLPLDVVHVTRRDRRAGRNEAGVRQHQGMLLPEDVVLRRGVEVVSATKTAIDITTIAGTEPSLVAVNHLLHEKCTTIDAVWSRYATMERDPRTLRTDLVLRLADARIESVGESRTLFLCWRQGLPAPEPQWMVLDEHGFEVARLDFAWPKHKVWLEFDGKEKYVKHLRDGETVADAVLREKRREEMIRELTGWRCIRITWADLFHPERLAARIRAMLASTSPVS
jgi:hypothetical protein